MKTFLILSVLIYMFEKTFSKNATDCLNLYLNKTITVPCVDNTTCCYLDYSYYNNNFTRCLLKSNSTEDLCSNLDDTIGFFYGSINVCDCFSEWVNYKSFYIILISMLYFL